MVQVLKKSVDFVSVHKRIIMILGLFLLTFVVVPQVVEAQSSLKISSLSDVESKAQEGSDTILNIAKYVLAAVLGIALVFVIYSLQRIIPMPRNTFSDGSLRLRLLW